MLTLYRPPRKVASDSDGETLASDETVILPPGRPYLTKINGKLVMARDKKEKAVDIGRDLLGEAFGFANRVKRIPRAKSLERYKPPLMVGGVPYQPQQQLMYPAPVPQPAFAPTMIQPLQQQLITAPQNASKNDLELLKEIDADYRYRVTGTGIQRQSSAQLLTSASTEEVTSKTTITITKHICANCGRLRSRKYHKENPIKSGDSPAPAFCGKCQKEVSSTSNSDSSTDEKKKLKRKKGKQKQKRKGKKDRKKDSDSSEDEPSSPKLKQKQKQEAKKVDSGEDESEVSEPQEKPKAKAKKRGPKKVHSREYIREEIEYSDKEVEVESGGRSSQRYGSHANRRPLSPFVPQSYIRTRSTDRTNIRSPSPYYEYVAASSISKPENTTGQWNRRSTLQSGEADGFEPIRGYPKHPNYREEYIYDHPQRSNYEQFDEIYEAAPPRSNRNSYEAPEISEYSFEEREQKASYDFQEAAYRNQREGETKGNQGARPWDEPHEIYPSPRDEKEVMTERYAYKPKRRGKIEEANASRYYQNDWSQDKPIPSREARRKGYRRDFYQDSEITVSEISTKNNDRLNSPPEQHLPRAPTPPSPIPSTSIADILPTRPIQRQRSREELAQKVNHERGRESTKQSSRERSLSRSRSRTRAQSNHRPPFVQEATDGGTEKSLIPSPNRSRNHSRVPSAEESHILDEVSGMTAHERIAEAGVRHVTFRERPESISSSSTERKEGAQGWGHKENDAEAEVEGAHHGVWDTGATGSDW
ncbi:hypothetical protein B7494_g8302 [Chlorociboria aeruginascens]|nr:hypothetical protein B7494_g8302 [Chlorociboria aeruginascens]